MLPSLPLCSNDSLFDAYDSILPVCCVVIPVLQWEDGKINPALFHATIGEKETRRIRDYGLEMLSISILPIHFQL